MTGNLIDYWITKHEVSQPECVLRGLRDIRRRNFDGVHLFNCSCYDHSDPEFVALMDTACRYAVKIGLAPLIHLPPHHDQAFLKRHPFATYKNLTEVVIPTGEAKFVHRLRYPGGCVFSEIVYACEFDSARNRLRERELAEFAWEIETSIIWNRCVYADRVKEVVIRGRKAAGKQLLLYIKFESDLIDKAHPALRRYMTEVLDLYRDMPIAGFGWDEPSHHCPGIGFFESSAIVTSTGIELEFQRLTGDPLAPHLPRIFNHGGLSGAAESRIAYYTALRDSLYRAQMFFKKQAQRRFGRNCELGIHHTHAETESSDLLIGNIDYPKLSECLSSGYTDGVFFFGPISTIYVSCLASSLGHRSDTGNAFCNLWCYRPRDWSVEFNTRLLGLFHVNWLDIGYGEGSAVKFPHHHSWPLHGTYARRLREFNAMLDGAKRVADVALIHTWQGVAADNSKYAVAHRVGMMRLILAATRQNRGLYIAGIDALGQADVRSSQIVIDGQSLSSLIVPWPFFLEPAARRKLDAFIAAGGRCLLYGHLPQDCPQNEAVCALLEKEFGRGFIRTEPKQYDFEKDRLTGAGLFGKMTLKPTREETEDKIAVRFRERYGTATIQVRYNALQIARGQPLLYHGHDLIGVKAADRPLYFFSFELPQYGAALSVLLPQLLPEPAVAAVPPNLYLQHYRKKKTDLYAVCARIPEGSLKGTITITGHTIRLPEGKMAVLTATPGKSVSVQAW